MARPTGIAGERIAELRRRIATLEAENKRLREAAETTVAACGCGGTGVITTYDLPSGEVVGREPCRWCSTLRAALEPAP